MFIHRENTVMSMIDSFCVAQGPLQLVYAT